MKYYRYFDPESYDEYTPGDKLYLEEYEVLKQTPCGIWILFPDRNRWNIEIQKYELGKKFILERSLYNKTTTNKRFAWLTKKEALISYIARKEKQIGILNCQLDNAKNYLDIAKEMQKDII